jgi:hypothetical protein
MSLAVSMTIMPIRISQSGPERQRFPSGLTPCILSAMLLLLLIILLIFGTGHGFYSGWNGGNGSLVGLLVLVLIVLLVMGRL